MKRVYESPRWKTLSGLQGFLEGKDLPVILMEGTRQLSQVDHAKLVSLGRMLAGEFPNAIFRTGNASGSDEAFAQGVGEVDTRRLQYVLPSDTMGKKRRRASSYALSLDEITLATEDHLVQSTLLATPAYRSMLTYYITHRDNPGPSRKAAYLLRDTLKVKGSPEHSLKPAVVGIFHVNQEDPLGGGTGHTIRVCLEQGVPVVMQQDWMSWLHVSGA